MPMNCWPNSKARWTQCILTGVYCENGTIEQYCTGQTWPTEHSPVLVEVDTMWSIGKMVIKGSSGPLLLLEHSITSSECVCVVGDSCVDLVHREFRSSKDEARE